MKREPEDRNKLKIASFRTTDGDWFDFSQAAEANGFTATDVLKACMVDYLLGTYIPAIDTPVSMRIQSAQGVSVDDAQALIDKATQPLFDGLINLQSQLAEVKADCDLTTEGIQRLIADALSKLPKPAAEPKELPAQQPTISAPSAQEKGISVSDFAKTHGLSIPNKPKAREVLELLVEHGLDKQWRYDSSGRRFISL